MIDAHGYVIIPLDPFCNWKQNAVGLSTYRREICVARSTCDKGDATCHDTAGRATSMALFFCLIFIAMQRVHRACVYFWMHIGHHIKEVFEALPKTSTVTWLAKELHCDRRNIYRIFAKNNIDILLLVKISLVLEHDFFADLSLDLRTNRTQSRSIQDTHKT